MAGGPRTQALLESGKAPEPDRSPGRVRRDIGVSGAGQTGCITIFQRPTRQTLARDQRPDCLKLAPSEGPPGARNLPPKNCPRTAPAGEDGRGGRAAAAKKFFCAESVGARTALPTPRLRYGQPTSGSTATVSATLEPALAPGNRCVGRSCFGDEFRSRFNGQVPAVDICRHPPRPLVLRSGEMTAQPARPNLPASIGNAR